MPPFFCLNPLQNSKFRVPQSEWFQLDTWQIFTDENSADFSLLLGSKRHAPLALWPRQHMANRDDQPTSMAIGWSYCSSPEEKTTVCHRNTHEISTVCQMLLYANGHCQGGIQRHHNMDAYYQLDLLLCSLVTVNSGSFGGKPECTIWPHANMPMLDLT